MTDTFDEMLRGMKDCKDGKPHKLGQSEEYTQGYAIQYQHEQNMTWEAQHGNRHRQHTR